MAEKKAATKKVTNTPADSSKPTPMPAPAQKPRRTIAESDDSISMKRLTALNIYSAMISRGGFDITDKQTMRQMAEHSHALADIFLSV